MTRDFSESSKKQLLALVKEVEDEQWCGFTDAIGDGFYGFEAWVGKLDVQGYIDNMSAYHKKVIDKNDATAGDIEAIFTKVNTLSEQYLARFTAQAADLRELVKTLDLLAQTIEPGRGTFTTEYIGTGLVGAVNSYLETSKTLQIMADDGGLTEAELKELDSAGKLQDILDAYAAVILDNIPNVKAGTKLEIPIAPGLVFYYEVSAKANGTGDIDLSAEIQDQKLCLKEFMLNGGNFSVGHNGESGPKIEASDEDGSGVSVSGTSLSGTTGVTIGPYTYNSKGEIDLVRGEVSLEYSITSNTEAGSVTTTVGIKSTDDPTPSGWAPIPAYVPVESPYPSQLPDLNWDWLPSGEEILVGTIIVAGVAAAIYFAPATGGLSLVAVGA